MRILISAKGILPRRTKGKEVEIFGLQVWYGKYNGKRNEAVGR